MNSTWLFERTRLWFRAFLLRDMESMHDLGAWYGSGDVAGQSRIESLRKAFYYYKKAAAAGHPESQYDLGFMVISGESEEMHYEEGIELIRESADSGFLPAKRLLSNLP